MIYDTYEIIDTARLRVIYDGQLVPARIEEKSQDIVVIRVDGSRIYHYKCIYVYIYIYIYIYIILR